MVSLLVSLSALGAAWHNVRWHWFDHDDLGRCADVSPQPVCIEAVVSATPQQIPPPPASPLRTIPPLPETRAWIEVTSVRNGFTWQSASGRARLLVPGRLPLLRAGDRIQVFGLLSAPSAAANPGEFDFRSHARADRCLCNIRVGLVECVQRVEPAGHWCIAGWVDAVRRRSGQLLDEYLSPQNAAIASALLLGERGQIDRETNDVYLQTGTVHILCVSGLHVAILATFLFKALRRGFVARRLALSAVVAITGAFMLLTGAEPPVVRATLLVWVVCGGLWMGRGHAPLNSLALAALVILAMNPADLFRTGVQLSFLSVAVIVWLVPKVAPRGDVDPLDRLIANTRPLPQRFAASVVRQGAGAFLIGTVLWLVISPLTMAQFHLLSPCAPLLNVALAPFVSLAMGLGFILLAIGWLAPAIGIVIGSMCDVAFSVIQGIVHFAAATPGSFLWTSGPTAWWLPWMYATAAAIVVLPRTTIPPRWRIGLASAWCGATLVASLPVASTGDELRCTFVSVGHGCAVVLELPNGRKLLYDAGCIGSPQSAERAVSSFLWSRKIANLDALFVSHADADHYNALPGLMRQFGVGAIYCGPQMFEQRSAALDVLQSSFDGSGALQRTLQAGDRLKFADDVQIEVLHPPADGVAGSDNANSVVLLVEYNGKRILLTGDLESPGLEMLMNEPRLDVDVVLAPHHGSARSDPPGFSAWSMPEWVVVSCGRREVDESVLSAYEARAATVLNTADCGAVTVSIRGGELDVRTFRGQK